VVVVLVIIPMILSSRSTAVVASASPLINWNLKSD